MKRLLLLVLILLPLSAEASRQPLIPWSFIATGSMTTASFTSFQATTLFATNASMTVLEVGGLATTYGSSSSRLGYASNNGVWPTFWLGSIGSSSIGGTAYYLGPQAAFPPASAPSDYTGWYVWIATPTPTLSLYLPTAAGAGMATFPYRITDTYIDVGDKRVASIATATANTDAVSLGQMNAQITSLTITLASTTSVTTLARQRVYTYTGATQTWVCPTGITTVYVTAVAGGGGGGGVSGDAGCDCAGGGGGGGSGIIASSITVVPGTSYNVYVGAGGAAGANTGGNGGTGGMSVFNTLYFYGGTGGTGGSTYVASLSAGVGGTTVVAGGINGKNGRQGVACNATGNNINLGGTGGLSAIGTAGGYGGASIYTANASSIGGDGSFGAGGGGAAKCVTYGAAQTGGAGGAGQVILEW